MSIRLAHAYDEEVAVQALEEDKADLVLVVTEEESVVGEDYLIIWLYGANPEMVDHILETLHPVHFATRNDYFFSKFSTLNSKLSFLSIVQALGGHLDEIEELEEPEGNRPLYLQEQEEED